MKQLKPFTVYKSVSYNIQLRDKFGNIIAVFPTIGGGEYATNQFPSQGLRRARKIAKLLNEL